MEHRKKQALRAEKATTISKNGNNTYIIVDPI